MLNLSSEAVLIGLVALLLVATMVCVVFWLRSSKHNTQLRGELTELQLQLQSVSDQARHLQTTMEQQRLAIEHGQTTQNQLSSRLSELSVEKEGVAARLTERSQQLTAAQHQILELTDKLAIANQTKSELSQKLAETNISLQEKQHYFEQQKADFEQQKQLLKTEFNNLANQILDQKQQSFSQTNKTELDSVLKPFKEQIEGFQKRINEVHTESVKGQAGLAAELKKVMDIGLKMSDDANNLTLALKGDKKAAGNWGEIQLERTLQLAGLVKGEHYDSQDHYVDSTGQKRLPDFVIKLPDDKHIIIDSKVSLVAYERAVAAENDAELNAALDEHVGAVKQHIDDLNKKDYANLIGIRSPSFVLMFMPIEPAYIEALKHKRDLFSYGYERNVILVSHTTLMPILKTVANLWRIERGNKEALEISERAGEIYNQVCLVAERLHKMGKTLTTVSNQYNDTVKSLAGKQGLVGKVERFASLSNKVSKQLPSLEMNHADVEYERLELVAEPVAEDDSDATAKDDK